MGTVVVAGAVVVAAVGLAGVVSVGGSHLVDRKLTTKGLGLTLKVLNALLDLVVGSNTASGES